MFQFAAVANACDRHIDPNNRAVFADAAFLHRIAGECSTPYSFPLREISFEIIGMSDVLKSEAQHFRFAVADNASTLGSDIEVPSYRSALPAREGQKELSTTVLSL